MIYLYRFIISPAAWIGKASMLWTQWDIFLLHQGWSEWIICIPEGTQSVRTCWKPWRIWESCRASVSVLNIQYKV